MFLCLCFSFSFFFITVASTSASAMQTDKPDEESLPPTKKRPLRSSTCFSQMKAQARSEHVLARICILCKKEKTITCTVTRKRKLERLTKCSTLEAAKLVQAANDNNNAELLLQIQGKDCVAIEVQYHGSCYKDFTRYQSRPSLGVKVDVDTKYSEAYNIFCKRIKELIIDNKEIYRLTKLNQMFIRQVKATHGVDAASYKTGNLKTRLMTSFPQMCFQQPQMRSQGYLVYVNNISKEVLVEDQKLLQEEMFSDSTCTDTDDDSDTDTETSLPQPRQPSTSQPKLNVQRESYLTALTLRNEIEDIRPSMPWPPSSDHLTVKTAEEIVPPNLYNFLAWTVGASDEACSDKCVFLPPATHRRILTIAQDIIYLQSKGRKQLPKHMSLAMTVRHLTGSAQLIGLLNGFGYSVSNSVVLNHDTAIATQQMNRGDNALPPGIQPRKPTSVVFDNNDFEEDTLTGKGTTHNTNGIVIQPGQRSSASDGERQQQQQLDMPSAKRTRERSMEAPPVDLAKYYGGKKEGPKPFGADISLQSSTYTPLLKSPSKLDLAYNITRFNIQSNTIPSWTGFNQLLSAVDVPPKSVIGYLPIIDASPTEMDTVLTILQRSIEIADKLELDSIVVVMDQAIYSKAQIIRWSNSLFTKRLVLRLGAFHTAMSFLGCIGKRFMDAGLHDILIEAEIVAAGSVNAVTTGKHYNRAVRAHKLMAEACYHMLLETFLQSINEDEAVEIRQLLHDMQTAYTRPGEYMELLSSDRFDQFQTAFEKFVKCNSTTKQTFAFWSSYCDMVGILLLFIRSIREGNWEMHLASIRSMLPWIFAYDRVNYSRYLPVYWMEMHDLGHTHPLIYQQFMEGEFVVQRSEKPFAQMPCDQTIEQTANRDSKTKGGMTGFTTSKGTVNRWIWSHHARGAITRECEDMASKSDRSDTRTDLLESRKKCDRLAVLRIVETTNAMLNPFEYEGEELIHITSGVAASAQVQQDISTAHHRGEDQFLELCEKRVKTGQVGLFDSIKKLKLKTFSNMSKTVKSRVRGQEVILRADRNLLARLVVIGRFRKIDLQELLSYSLGPLPLPLASAHGGLVKTNKANLLHALESQPETDASVSIPDGAVFIVDGMALIQQLNINRTQEPRTFLNYAKVVLQRIIDRATSHKSMEIHFVTDTYRDISIKNAERAKRAADGSQVMRIYGQALPQQWKKFLANGKNKESLIEYLFDTWSKLPSTDLKGVHVYVAHGKKCHSLTPGITSDEKVIVTAIDCLNSNQEEADTRMFLHAAYAANTRGASDIIIESPDTDVFIIAMTFQSVIAARLYFHTGRGMNLRTIDLEKIKQSIGNDVSHALIGLHCMTGCDSVSAFYGKGKKKALNLLLKDNSLCSSLKDLGERFDINPDMAVSLEKFVCMLYGQNEVNTVNEARHNLFRLARKSEIGMPPNRDSLMQHVKRANYQSGKVDFNYQSPFTIKVCSHKINGVT